MELISGNGNSKILLIFQEVTFRARKMKKSTLKMLLIFQEIEKLSCTLGLLKFCLLRDNFLNINVK